MSSFKDRPLKKCHSDKRLTIDVIHSNVLESFKNEKNEMCVLNEEIKNEKDDSKIKFLEKKKKKINDLNNKKKYDYFLDNGLLLNTYYNNNGEIKKYTENTYENNILNYFQTDKVSKSKNIEDENNENDNIIETYLSNIDDSCINNNFKDIDEMLHKCIIKMFQEKLVILHIKE